MREKTWDLKWQLRQRYVTLRCSCRPITERIMSASAFKRIHIAEFQTGQAVHAVKVGLAADKLDGGLRGFFLALKQ